MPDEKTVSRKGLVKASELSVFDEEIFLTGGVAIGPETVCLEARLYVCKDNLVVLCLIDHVDPALVCFAPYEHQQVSSQEKRLQFTGRRMNRPIPSIIHTPVTVGHHTPFADTT